MLIVLPQLTAIVVRYERPGMIRTARFHVEYNIYDEYTHAVAKKRMGSVNIPAACGVVCLAVTQ